MTFLPIVDRELRIRARWKSTYFVRAGIAVIAIAVTVVMSIFFLAGASGTIGNAMLRTLAWISFGFCVLEGLRSTADSVSEEKREGTLGLLFLTDLRGYDVVLGKFAASSLSSFYGLIAAVPTLAVPVLMGGVTGAEFWRVVLALANGLFFSLCSGMLVSVMSRGERRAWSGTVVLVGIGVVGLAVVHSMTGSLAAAAFSPSVALLNAFEPEYSARSGLYWVPLAVSHCVSWTLLGAASVILPRAWQESGEQRRAAPARRADSDKWRRTEMLSINPAWWLTSRHTYQRRFLWLALVVIVAIAFVVWGSGGGSASVGWGLAGFALTTHLIITVWVATEACYSFADARSSGAMELLLSTPLTIRQIVHGQQFAIRDLFFKPVLFLIGAEILLLTFQVVMMAQRGSAGGTMASVIVVVIFSAGWFLLDLLAVSRVGMWFSLTSAKPTHALTRTILFVVILPALLLPCISVMGPGLMVAKSVIFLTWAQTKLDHDFRAAATRRFDVPRSPRWSGAAPPPLVLPT